MSDHEFTVRPTRLDDGPALNDLYRRLTGIQRSIEQWRWEWFDCPGGPAPSWVIVERAYDRIVGHHGVVPVPLVHGAERLNAARTENTMIDPDVRRRIVYPPIEAKLLSEVLQRFDPIFTTSGKGSHGLIRKRLGYRSVGTWRTFTISLTPSYVAQRLGGRVIGRTMSLIGRATIRRPFGWSINSAASLTQIAEICDRWRDPTAVTPDRSADHLRWRLVQHPYARIELGILHRHGEAAAFLAWRTVNGRNATREILIDDICTASSDTDTIKSALGTLTWLHRSDPARVQLRTLDNDRPLARVARLMDSRYRRGGAGDGAELLVRSNRGVNPPWDVTMVLTEGI